MAGSLGHTTSLVLVLLVLAAFPTQASGRTSSAQVRATLRARSLLGRHDATAYDANLLEHALEGKHTTGDSKALAKASLGGRGDRRNNVVKATKSETVLAVRILNNAATKTKGLNKVLQHIVKFSSVETLK